MLTDDPTFVKHSILALIPIIIGCLGIFVFDGGNAIWFIISAIIFSVFGYLAITAEIIEDTTSDQKKLPIWSVAYIVLQNILTFAFIYFGIHLTYPGSFRGFSKDPKHSFLDSIYFSLAIFNSGSVPDIVPQNRVSRIAIGSQLITSMITLVFMASKIISQFS